MDQSEQEFDIATRRSGLDVPPELRAGTLAGYRELRRLTTLLRSNRHVESEPAYVYRIGTETSHD